MEVVGQGLETAEVPRPAFIVEIAEPDLLGPPPVEEAGDGLRKCGGRDRIVKIGAELEDAGVGAIGLHGRLNAAIPRAMHAISSAAWTDRYWTSRDGLRLHYRDYAGSPQRPPVLCLHGLTRNARDFEDVAERLAGQWRVIVPSFRGRGLSQHDPNPKQYSPPVYVADILQLLDELGIAEAVFIGTSLGGLVTMGVAMVAPQRIAGALLNDVGPELDEAGLDRIGTYVGRQQTFRDWDEAASAIAERNRAVCPRYGDEDWKRFVRRICRQTPEGVGFDYDMRIADNFKLARSSPAGGAWPAFRRLRGVPLLIVRGALSDLLSVGLAERMLAEHPDAELVTVPEIGHAPSLSEPEAEAAIDRLLGRVLAARASSQEGDSPRS